MYKAPRIYVKPENSFESRLSHVYTSAQLLGTLKKKFNSASSCGMQPRELRFLLNTIMREDLRFKNLSDITLIKMSAGAIDVTDNSHVFKAKVILRAPIEFLTELPISTHLPCDIYNGSMNDYFTDISVTLTTEPVFRYSDKPILERNVSWNVYSHSHTKFYVDDNLTIPYLLICESCVQKNNDRYSSLGVRYYLEDIPLRVNHKTVLDADPDFETVSDFVRAMGHVTRDVPLCEDAETPGTVDQTSVEPTKKDFSANVTYADIVQLRHLVHKDADLDVLPELKQKDLIDDLDFMD